MKLVVYGKGINLGLDNDMYYVGYFGCGDVLGDMVMCYSLVGNGWLSYLCDILFSELFCFVCVIVLLIFVSRCGLFLLMLMKYGEFLIMNLILGWCGGFFVRIVVVMMLLVVINWICFDRNVWIVVLLFLKCLIVVFGVSCDSVIFLSVLCVVLIVLLVRLVGVFIFMLDGLNMFWKYGVYVFEKLMIFLCFGVLLSDEIIMLILLVVRYGIWFVLFMGISFSLMLSVLVRSFVMLML